MDFHLKQQRSMIQNIKTTLISPNGKLILLVRDPWKGLLINSTKNLKQIWKFTLESFIQEFSPSSQVLAFGSRKGQLSVIKLGKQEEVYKIKLGDEIDRNIIKYIKFQNENTLVAVSFHAFAIYKLDIQNKREPIILHILMYDTCTFSYGGAYDIILFQSLKTECLQVLKVKNGCGSELFKSENFTNRIQQMQLLDDQNLVLVNFICYSKLYKIDYQQKSFKQIEIQIPQSSFESNGIKLCRDQIITIAPKDTIIPNQLTIQFSLFDNPNIIRKQIQIPSVFMTTQQFQVANQVYLVFQIQYSKENQHLIILRGCPK